jgi:glutamyl-tRNA reductase
MQGRAEFVPGKEEQTRTFEAGRHRMLQLNLLLIGSSFKTSSIEFREKLMSDVCSKYNNIRWWTEKTVSELTILSTCNRIEFYLVTNDPEFVLNRFKDDFVHRLGVSGDLFYYKTGFDVVRHLFRVAAGLDSMVLGEEQITSQVREAGIKARVEGNSRSVLSALFDSAVNVGLKVRKHIGGDLDSKGTSISSFALNFAINKLGRKPKSVLIIGSGKMARITMKCLSGVRIFVVTKRRKSLLGNESVTVLSKDELANALGISELVITATSGPNYVISKNDLSPQFRGLILDLGFPRNVDPSIKECASCELYDLDDLAKISAERFVNRDYKWAEERIFDEAVKFNFWLTASKLNPTLAKLYTKVDQIRRKETLLTFSRIDHLSENDKKTIEVFGRRIVSKILAMPTEFVRESSSDLPQNFRFRLIQDIFKLEEN